MIGILGSKKKLCDGLTRRDLLHAGGSALLGLSLADIAASTAGASAARPRQHGRAKNVILLYLYGAVSQIDTLDPKPDDASHQSRCIRIRGRTSTLKGDSNQLHRQHIPPISVAVA